MTFLAPAWLALLALVVPVVLLHMRKRKRVTVPSLLLWEGVAGTARPSSSLRRPPLTLALLLQVLAVALVALALARPYVGPQGVDHLVILLDVSASQDTDSLQTSLGRLDQLVAGAAGRRGAAWSLVLVGPRPEPAAVRWPADSTSAADVRDRVAIRSGPADWDGAAHLAGRLTEEDEAAGNTSRVVLIGPSATAASDALRVLPEASTVVVAGGAAVALASAELRLIGRATDAAGEADAVAQLSLSGEVAGAPGAPEEAALELTWRPAAPGRAGGVTPGGERSVGMVPLALADDGARSGTFELLLDVAPTGLSRTTLGTLDVVVGSTSATFVVYEQPRVVRVLYVGRGNLPVASALRALPYVELTETADVGAVTDAGEYDLMIIDDVAVPQAPLTSAWWIGAARVDSSTTPPTAGEAWLGPWADGPLTTPTDWTALDLAGVVETSPLDGGAVLVASSAGPLVQLRYGGAGLELRTPFDLAGSGWTDEAGFPLFVRALVGIIEPNAGLTVGAQCVVGLECRLPAGTRAVLDPGGAERPVGSAAYGADLVLSGSFVPTVPGLHVLAGARTARQAIGVAGFVAGLPALSAAAAAGEAAGPGPVPLRRPLLTALLVVLALELLLWWRSPTAAERRANAGGVARAGFQTVPGLGSRLVTLALVALALTDVAAPLPARGGQLLLAHVGADQSARPVDAEAAVDLVAASAHPGVPARLLLTGDGTQTRGDLARAVARAAGAGLRVDAAPDEIPGEVASSAPKADASVQRVGAPAAVLVGDTYELVVVLYATEAGDATVQTTVTALADAMSAMDAVDATDAVPTGASSLPGSGAVTVVDEREVSLAEGENLVLVEVTATEPGRHRFEVTVRYPEDRQPANDVGVGWVNVHPAPVVLVVGEEDGWRDVFVAALEAQGLQVAAAPPALTPADPAELAAFGAVALMNLPAASLTTAQQLALEAAVTGSGLPLLLLGGENAFGPGGYLETPLEGLSPTSSLVPREAPELAVAFVLDRSNSMRQYAGDAVRLDIAKVATLRAHELLPEGAQSSLIVFDSIARTLVPLSPAADSDEFVTAVLELDPRGGTNLYPALVEAHDQLAGAGAAASHVIVMSDGLSQPGDFPGILEALRAEGITVSTIAIGPEADADQLREVAQLGGGVFHSSTDFSALPSIMAQEVLLQSGELTGQRDLTPAWQGRRSAGLRAWPDALPPVGGYVRTSTKPGARVHLTVTEDDGQTYPLLASWHAGRGEVFAFTAHAAGPWTREWVGESDYALMWAHLTRQLFRLPTDGGSGLALSRDGDVLRVSSQAAPISLVRPDGTATRLPVVGLAQGYEAAAVIEQTGLYTVEAAGATVTFEVPYAAALDPGRSDPGLLAATAKANGGAVVQGTEAAEAPSEWYLRRWPVWPFTACLTLLLFLLELIRRYAPDLLARRPRRERDARKV